MYEDDNPNQKSGSPTNNNSRLAKAPTKDTLLLNKKTSTQIEQPKGISPAHAKGKKNEHLNQKSIMDKVQKGVPKKLSPRP